MNRRFLITLLGGAAMLPVAARAQPAVMPVKRIGVLRLPDETDPNEKVFLSEFTHALQDLGWIDGRNVRVDARWAAGNLDRMRMLAKELVELRPDVIVVSTTAVTRAVQEQTRTIPIIFLGVGDPVASGLVASISRPEGNTTGITNLVSSIGGKWVDMLNEAVPGLRRIAFVFNPGVYFGAYLASVQAAAARYSVTVVETPVRDSNEMERAIEAFATEPNGALIVPPPSPAGADREVLNRLTVQHRLPTIYMARSDAAEGGLMSYGPDRPDQFRRGISYVDHILRGAKISELPVQLPTKFDLVINLKTAKMLGLALPESVLLRADEVIE
jgi:putative ABC transport system substrate-binding protein